MSTFGTRAVIPILKALKLIEAAWVRYSQLQRAAYSETARLLEQLGRAEYRAAIKALRDTEKSKDPRRERESAITCLRLAIEKFEISAASKGLFADWWSDTFMDVISPAYWAIAESRLLTVLHKQLCEERLAEENAIEAASAFNKYAASMASHHRYRTPLPLYSGGVDHGIRDDIAYQLQEERRITKSILDRVGYGGNLLADIEEPEDDL